MKKQPHTLRQVSAGGVVFKRVRLELRICLIGRRRMGKIVWCLPKGHVEKGETHREAALREVLEETGIRASLLGPISHIKYRFFDLESKKQIAKTVYFFLMEYLKGNLNDHDDEVECARWFSPGQALTKVEYPSELSILKKAVQTISSL